MTPEAAVLKQITDYLTAEGVWWMRIQPFNGKTASGHWMRCAKVGCADLLCSVDGKIMWVEVKGPKGKQTQEQIDFQEVVEQHGHFYVVAYGFEIVRSSIGVLRK